jgi:uncharacterized protein YgiM (DUF1202 family)
MKIVFFLLISLLPFSLAAAETMYVQSNQAKLMSEPAFKAKQLAILQRADKVEVLKKTKRWYRIRHQGETGWVSKLLLSPQPPLNQASVLKGDNSALQAQARRRASSTASAAATRGLRQASPQNTEPGQADFQAVDAMESVEVSPEEAKAFLDERSKH